MTTYVVFVNRKKRFDETLNEYYESITLGTVDTKSAPQALNVGSETFHREKIALDVIALRHASIFQKQVLDAREKAKTLPVASRPTAQKKRTATTKGSVKRAKSPSK